jgi:hypothetical protein
LANKITEKVLSLYAETRDFYRDQFQNLGEAACGFRILYGPPIVGAPILFIGDQPGGDATHLDEREHWEWPRQCEYAVQDWPLTRMMRKIWSAEYLSHCTGLNSIFFRSRNKQTWAKIPLNKRREMERFCYSRLPGLIKELAPMRVVCIGLGPFNQLADQRSDALVREGRVLVKTGTLCGIRADGVIHLSGAQIRTDHRAAITDYFAT